MRSIEAPLLQKSPEEYIRDTFYFASQPLGEPMNPEHMQQIIDMVGAENLMFASDFPHWDMDDPGELTQHLEQTFTDEEQEMVLHKNAADAYGI